MPATATRPATFYPQLLYRDAAAAMSWLEQTLGFERGEDHRDADGNVQHAELSLDGAIVMLGSAGVGREPFRSLRREGASSTARSTTWTASTRARARTAPTSHSGWWTRTTARATSRSAIRRATSGPSAPTGPGAEGPPGGAHGRLGP